MPLSETAVRANNAHNDSCLGWLAPPQSLSYRSYWFSMGYWLSWLACTMAGVTMWMYCPGHSPEQESDSIQQTMSSLEQHCSPFSLPLPHSLPDEVCPSQYSLRSCMSHWVTGISRGTLKIATRGHAALLNPWTHPSHTHTHNDTLGISSTSSLLLIFTLKKAY